MTDIPITKRPVVCRMPGQDSVTVRRDIPYRDGLTLDLYGPHESTRASRTPAVLFVTGYPDPGFQKMLGCMQKEMTSYINWAELMAASGLIAVTYANREPVADAEAVLAFIRENAEAFGLDETRIGVWSCSGNVPTALSVLMNKEHSFKCAALCYGLMLDVDGRTAVADGATKFGYKNPAAGKTVGDLPRDLPLFLVRAGRDEFPHLNETLDRFVAKALEIDLPITLVNHPDAPHAFDVANDTETSRYVIRRLLDFMRFHLLAASDETIA